jgi:hypothetical protein
MNSDFPAGSRKGLLSPLRAELLNSLGPIDRAWWGARRRRSARRRCRDHMRPERQQAATIEGEARPPAATEPKMIPARTKRSQR